MHLCMQCMQVAATTATSAIGLSPYRWLGLFHAVARTVSRQSSIRQRSLSQPQTTHIPTCPGGRTAAKKRGQTHSDKPPRSQPQRYTKSSPCTQHTTHNTRKEEGRAESKKTEQRRELTAPVIQDHALSSATVLLSGRERAATRGYHGIPRNGPTCLVLHTSPTHAHIHARAAAGGYQRARTRN